MLIWVVLSPVLIWVVLGVGAAVLRTDLGGADLGGAVPCADLNDDAGWIFGDELTCARGAVTVQCTDSDEHYRERWILCDVEWNCNTGSFTWTSALAL